MNTITGTVKRLNVIVRHQRRGEIPQNLWMLLSITLFAIANSAAGISYGAVHVMLHTVGPQSRTEDAASTATILAIIVGNILLAFMAAYSTAVLQRTIGKAEHALGISANQTRDH